MLEWIDSNGIVLVIGMFVYSNIVAALPRPVNGNAFYRFLFTFLNLTAANAPKVFPSLRILAEQAKPPPE